MLALLRGAVRRRGPALLVVCMGAWAIHCGPGRVSDRSGPHEPVAETRALPAPATTNAPHDPALASTDEVASAAAPGALDDETYERLLAKLVSFPADHIGAIGGGPVMPAADTLVARELTKGASEAQLRALLRHPRPAVRAHVAREIIHVRPAAFALIRVLFDDRSRLRVGSMADTPPIRDEVTTVGALARGLIDNCYQCPKARQ